MTVMKEIYKPSLNVGQVYAKVYGVAGGRLPVGNVTKLEIGHKEDVQSQPDMTMLGGGKHAEVRRVTDVEVSMTMADVNVSNLARAVLATVEAVDAGSVTGEEHTVYLGGLLRLAHIQPTDVVVKKASVVVPAAGNYEVRAGGVFILPTATGLADADAVTVDYAHGIQAVIEALTTSANELELVFEGLNEADSGKPVIVDIWRVSQGVTKSLALLTGKFGALEVTGAVLMDPTKTGAGISRYYRKTMV